MGRSRPTNLHVQPEGHAQRWPQHADVGVCPLRDDGLRLSHAVARASARIMSGLSGVLAPGKLDIEAAAIWLRHLGSVDQRHSSPGPRRICSHGCRGPCGRSSVWRRRRSDRASRRGQGRPGSWPPAFLRSSLMVAKISPTASSPLEIAMSGFDLQRVDAVRVGQLRARPRYMGCQPTAWSRASRRVVSSPLAVKM